MSKVIRVLDSSDYPYVEAMETGIENDYVKRVFEKLSTGKNRVFGLFVNGQLVSLGGISIYAKRYAMLGRLRSDHRFRGNDFATEIMNYMMNEAFKLKDIQWVGANTQEENLPAQRVIEKIGLQPYTMIHGALTKDTTSLETGANPWNQIHDLERKKKWLEMMYIKPTTIFPFECYYPFPATKDLFEEDHLKEWSFYENDAKDRFLITKLDQKKYKYVHAVYPWSDITDQEGLWETIAKDYKELMQQTEDEAYIWMDLTKEETQKLPTDHQFTLPSPWILYGIERKKFEKINQVIKTE